MKTILWIVVIAAIAAGGFALYRHSQGNDANTPATVTAVQGTEAGTTAQQPAPSGKKVPFSTFIKGNTGAYQCTVHQALSDTDSSGTVYLSNGMIRGDATAVAEGKTVSGSFLIRDGYQYVWQRGSTSGFKMQASASTSGDASAPAAGTYQWAAEQIGDYDCQPWTADASLFAVPATIHFTDMSSFSIPGR